ncbi:MAG: Rieske 2Fe-2S domain-containing protein [Deltaproteobacteria bacterium]|nr:Rieske 2Fe-2S domain-containing protein [Deltaproteobacteria bacterium]
MVDVSGVARGRPCIFGFERDGEPLTGMIVADATGALHVYVNRCPHVPYSLDLGDGNVLDPDGLTIVCSNHGARFDPDTGRCRWGPVRGRFLEPLPFRRDGDRLVITIAPEAEGWPEDFEPPPRAGG